jgi:hypothetical protein
LVYGNAVKNGKTNEVSYHPGGTASSTFATTFVNHLDADITAPCLEDNANVAPATAELLWNDASADFIAVDETLTTKSVTLDGTTKSIKYLTFQIPQASIKQGNAVIAVKDSEGTILWSWHIWVTDEASVATKAVTNYMDEVNEMMVVNLGYCDKATTTYAERSVKVVFTQDDTNETQSFILTEKSSSTSATIGNNTYYQWGRKDAFLPTIENNKDKIAYNTSGTITSEAFSFLRNDTATIGTNIQHPTVHYDCEYSGNGMHNMNPCNASYYNLWSAQNTKSWGENSYYDIADSPIIKTIYDPCPVEFHVASANAFTGFTTTGQNSDISGCFNVSGDFDNGWNFCCNKNKDTSGGTIFFPALSFRYLSSGVTYNVGRLGYVWCAVSSETGYGRYLYFSYQYSLVKPVNKINRAYGLSVRPIREKEGE